MTQISVAAENISMVAEMQGLSKTDCVFNTIYNHDFGIYPPIPILHEV